MDIYVTQIRQYRFRPCIGHVSDMDSRTIRMRYISDRPPGEYNKVILFEYKIQSSICCDVRICSLTLLNKAPEMAPFAWDGNGQFWTAIYGSFERSYSFPLQPYGLMRCTCQVPASHKLFFSPQLGNFKLEKKLFGPNLHQEN